MFDNYRSVGTMETLSEKFRSLGDPTRLAIFNFIRACGANVEIDEDSGDCCCVSDTCVGDICCNFEIAPSTVSHHLKELRNAGLISMEKRGRWVYVTVNQDALTELRDFIAQPPQLESGTKVILEGAGK